MPSVKCLLVDDLEENLLALSALLADEGVELLQARSGAQALELLLVHNVALALLDVQMPEMDGFELAELMRGSERTRDVPIIFVTAGARDQHRQFKGYDSGAVDFLYKPIEPHILRSKVRVFFQLYRQRQQLAEDLRERTETLRLNEMFTAMLGHDLRNPVSAMIIAATLLQRQAQDEAIKKSAARLLASGKRMSRMIQDMLDLARARLAGGIPLRLERVDLVAIVDSEMEDDRLAFPDRQIEFSHRGDVSGDWDGDRLAQVVGNLVGNALQHGDEKPVRVDLDCSDADSVVLTISNGGVIAADLRPFVFDPFRSRSQTGRSDGLGIGLYIVQQIVAAHGGEVTVEATSDERTSFRAVLPRRRGGMA